MGIGTIKRAIFFDRDGVLNRAILRDGKPHPPASLAELQIDPAAAPGIALLHALRFITVIVTNQPDVARGKQRRETVEAINLQVRRSVGADAVYTCFHDNADQCECRKPKPGLILQSAHDLQIDVLHSYLIGDRHGDIQAGISAGCATVFIDRRYPETPPATGARATVESLDEAIKYIISLESEARDER